VLMISTLESFHNRPHHRPESRLVERAACSLPGVPRKAPKWRNVLFVEPHAIEEREIGESMRCPSTDVTEARAAR